MEILFSEQALWILVVKRNASPDRCNNSCCARNQEQPLIHVSWRVHSRQNKKYNYEHPEWVDSEMASLSVYP